MLKTKVLVPLVAALGFAAVPAMSATVEYYEVQVAPPALQVETIPAPQTGMTWVPGYYDYRDGQPVYREGRYYTGRWARAGEEEHGGARNKIREAKNKVKDRIKNGDKDDQ